MTGQAARRPRRLAAAGWVLSLAALAMSSTGRADAADWLSVCPDRGGLPPTDEAGHALRYWAQPEAGRWVVAGAARPPAAAACSSMPLPVSVAEIRWIGVVSESGRAMTERVDLQIPVGREFDDVRDVEIVLPAVSDGDPAPTPAVETLAPTAPTGREPPRRSGWSWAPDRWMQDGSGLLDEAAALGIGVLYISVPVEESGFDPQRLADFIADAGGRGIAVWAVEGDPHAVQPGPRERFVRRAAALAAYNAARPTAERLAGIQYDIEPYLLPGYAADPAGWQAAYVETIAALRRAADLPTEIAIPFWFGRDGGGQGPLLDRLAPHVDSVAVMAYRTDVAELRRFVEPIFVWAEGGRRDIRIALENGTLPDRANTMFVRRQAGELWLVDFARDRLAILLRGPAGNPHGPAYARQTDWPVPADRISFGGRLDVLLAVARSLEADFAGRRGFAGIALHGVLGQKGR
ncbi:MAG: hypothetical protein HKM95_15805 [Inquilinus sp.]|nr:hypothetical protein [Inquilinus sp.]